MLLMQLLVIGAMGTVMTLSMRFFSPQQLQDRFEEGQKLYVLGAYEKAIERYETILATQSNSMLNMEEVTITVDEFILPVRVGATYQLGNTYNKLGLEKLQRSEFLRAESKEAEAEARYREALANLNASVDHFRQLATDEEIDERTRVMAQYRMAQTSYELKNYEQVIQEGEALLRNFPHNVYEASTYYDIAWSYFELQQYQKAIENFEQVLILAPRGTNADRSYFQIATSYEHMGQDDKALDYLERLKGRYDFAQMTEKEIIEMTTLKLRGVVKETTRELIAKASLMTGDIFAKNGETEKALAAYAILPAEYAAEPVMVQNSYIRSAELIHQARGTQAAIAAYKNAIEKVEDKVFQARTQLTVALMLFDEEQFLKAADEYEIYLKAYGDVASRIGFGGGKALFRQGQCYQGYGRQLSEQDPALANEAVDKALAIYQQLQDEFRSSTLLPDVLLNAGFAQQLKKENDAAKPFYRRLVETYPEHPAAPSGLVQLARIEYSAANYAEAGALYRSVLDQYPDSDLRNTANMELGITCKWLKDPGKGIAAYEAVEEGWEQWPKVQVQLAELYIEQQDLDRAKEVLGRALEQAKGEELQGQTHYTVARVHFSQGDYEGAAREWSLAIELSPPDHILEGSLLARGGAYYEMAKQQDATGDTASARISYEASVADMKALLDRNPEPQIKDSAFRALGAGMIRLERGKEAASYYQKLIAATEDPQEQATFRMLLTELYYDQQDFSQAEHFARQLLDMEFEDDNQAGYYRKERAYSIVGNALMQQKKYQEAARVFAQGLKRYPSSGESGNLAFSKAFAEISVGDYETAAESFKAFIGRYPNNDNRIHGQYYLAHSHQALTQFDEAAQTFEELVRRYPGSDYEEEALFLIGESYYNTQDFETAATAYQKLLATYPRGSYGASAQYALGWSYVEEERMDEAVQALAILVERYPRSEFASKSQFTIGDYHYNTQSYAEASEAYGRVIDEYPDSDEAPRARSLVTELKEIQASFDYNKAMAFLEAKQYSEAVTSLKEIIEKYPGTYTELAAHCNLGLTYEISRQWVEAAESYQVVEEKGGASPENADVVSFARLHREWLVENRL